MFMNLRGCKIDLTPTLKHDEVTPPLGLPSGLGHTTKDFLKTPLKVWCNST